MKLPLFILFMGVIGAWIGWITNVLAIRLLFRPYRVYRIPLLGWQFQGLIPKRQKDIAKALADIVSTELITGNDVAQSLARDEITLMLADKVEGHVREKVLLKMPFLIPQALQAAIAEFVGKTLRHEATAFLQRPMQMMSPREMEEIKKEIQKIVEKKVLSFDLEHLEEITYAIARRELKHIEILGGVLGFSIGVVQGIITFFIR